MQLKRFRGKSVPEVMRQVREELGPDAVILHTKPLDAPGVLKLRGESGVEILAAVDPAPRSDATLSARRADKTVSTTAPAERRAATASADRGPAPRSARGPVPLESARFGTPAWPRVNRAGEAETMPAEPKVETRGLAPAAPAAPTAADALGVQLAELRELLVRAGGRRFVAGALERHYDQLVLGGVDESLAMRLLAELPRATAGGDALRALEDAMAQRLAPAAVSAARAGSTIALVGPAGAGKSTTVAKLAARARLDGSTVAVVSFDDVGLGAPSHLETFAEILGVPYTFAATLEALRVGAVRHASAGAVLIDTPGLSARDTTGLARLADVLRAVAPSEVHLVLPATSKAADALAAVRAFGGLQPTHVLFTKLDETETLGSVYTVCVESKLPLSYETTGREIPDDLHPAAARRLVRRVLAGPQWREGVPS